MASSNYKGISVQLSADVTGQAEDIIDNLGSALLSAMISMKEVAVNNFVNNHYGYLVDTLKDAIVAGPLKLDGDSASVTLHALGAKSKPNSFKARFFVGGTNARFHSDGSYSGIISPTNVIEDAMNEQLLVDRIYNAINKNK